MWAPRAIGGKLRIQFLADGAPETARNILNSQETHLGIGDC